MLECPTNVWDGMTSVDIAMAGRCDEFIESCTRSALDRRFAGDLEPYGQHIGPLYGFKRIVLACFFTGGFIAPFVMHFTLPPGAPCLRHPTQRRTMPKGYPHQPQKNEVLKAKHQNEVLKAKHQKKKDSMWSWFLACWFPSTTSDSTSAVRWARFYLSASSGDGVEQQIGEEQLKELWHPTFSYWERLRCFWKAPVVLYLANATVQVAIAVAQTYFITTHYVSDSAKRAEIQLLEWVWLAYSIASSAEEFVHALVDGIHTYMSDIWNAVDFFAALFFWIGFGVRISCWNDGAACAPSLQQGPEHEAFQASTRLLSREEVGLQFYSVSLFCLWVRLLRILSADPKLGPLVLVLRSMVVDTLQFGVMWVVLLMAFSAFIFGSGINNDVNNNECEASEFPIACSTGWWVIRTYFQAMGEPLFIEEMSTMSSVIIVMMLCIMMNLVLVNLLIAMMSNTYQNIKSKSERQWMIDLYQLIKEASRFALTVPAPFNLLWIVNELIVFVWHLRDRKIKALFEKLYGKHISWRLKLRHFVERNMAPHQLLEERNQAASQEKKERQKLSAFMERARINWSEGRGASEGAQARVEQRLYEMKNQIDNLFDRMTRQGENIEKMNRRASMVSLVSSENMMGSEQMMPSPLQRRAGTPEIPPGIGATEIGVRYL